MTLGRQLRRPDLPTAGARWCEAALPEGSVYRFLARERTRLFPPELFADLFQLTGRRSVPPSILAVVMVLQRLEGLSDREATDRFGFDVRWRDAAGVADAVAGEETASFAHTVLVDLRARRRASVDPDRSFRVTCRLARQLGLVGVKGVLDSAPLEDAVATQDTVTMLGGAIRGLLRACPPALKAKVRAACSVRTTTPRRASRPVTGRIGPPGRCWWTRWSAMPTGPLRPGWGAAGPSNRCGGQVVSHRDRPRHRRDRRRPFPDLCGHRPRPGHLHRRPPSAAWA